MRSLGSEAIADVRNRLSFATGPKAKLAIAQGTGTSAQDTFIRIAASGELLASLTGLSANSITSNMFAVV